MKKFVLSDFFLERALHFYGKINLLDQPVCDGAWVWVGWTLLQAEAETDLLPALGNRCERVGPRDWGRPPAPSSQLFRKINKVVKCLKRRVFISKAASEGSVSQAYLCIGITWGSLRHSRWTHNLGMGHRHQNFLKLPWALQRADTFGNHRVQEMSLQQLWWMSAGHKGREKPGGSALGDPPKAGMFLDSRICCFKSNGTKIPRPGRPQPTTIREALGLRRELLLEVSVSSSVKWD